MSIDLSRFCCTVRKDLAVPFSVANGTAACNGHLVVWVDQPCETRVEGLLPTKVAGYVMHAKEAAALDGDWRRMDALASTFDPCHRCSGSGHVHVVTCDECDGDGEFRHGSHFYQCQACYGSGECVESGDASGVRCRECCGTGKAQQLVPGLIVTNAMRERRGINAIYAEQLRLLPHAEICTALVNDCFPIRFDGGVAMLMAMRA